MTTIILAFLLLNTQARADDKDKAPPAATPAATSAPAGNSADQTSQTLQDTGQGERVNVENIKQKYWARGDESELGVVQNRLYSKAGKFELGLLGGVLSTDPFLSVRELGGSLGYHFSEYISVHAIGWKSFVGTSSAYDAFNSLQATPGVPAIPDSNYQKYFTGAEVRASLLYGKLSVLGKAIIYYDFRVLGGMGFTKTETGNEFTPYLGIGQQVFLSKQWSLLIDYRLMRYGETLLQKSNPAALGQLGSSRTNWTDAITLGLGFMFGIGGK
jgi:outer membrane beta-barrel protein